MREVSLTSQESYRALALAINELARGRINSLLQDVTLTPDSATTVINSPKITPYSALFLSPRTANAAAALGGLYVSAIVDGQATLTHANNAQVDKTFDILVKTGEP